MFPALNSENSDVALVDGEQSISYARLNDLIDRYAAGLLDSRGLPDDRNNLNEERVAFFLPACVDYVVSMHAIWRAGGIAVPLNVASAEYELEHYLGCARVTRLIDHASEHEFLKPLCERLNVKLLAPDQLYREFGSRLPQIAPERRAMIVFTSGTTNKPKGVVSTHRNIAAQIETLIESWCWTDQDAIPLFLPLHHVHGIINVLCCGLWAGASVHLYARFDAQKMTRQVAAGDFNLFMAVPTIYVKLIQYLDELDEPQRQAICSGFSNMRLNVSGSAACPVQLFNDWQQRTGQVLLERYGMTEIGMGLTNPYGGERRAGYVGQPFSNVDVELFDEQNRIIEGEQTPGEIRVRGANVFKEYWDNPKATAESFVDGWFCTGDMAVREDGFYRIMGRSSIDIIKSGGYKLSALEIEGILLTHPAIREVAVLGAPDEVWGEAVVAFIALKAQATLEFQELKSWCTGRMSTYKIPKRIEVLDSLPRNAMGKVTKPDLKKRINV